MFSFLSGSETENKSSGNGDGDGDIDKEEYRRFPILIIPGFMSSGLKIEQSDLFPTWNGKRLWLNIGSLGLAKLQKIASKPWDNARDEIHPGKNPLSSHHAVEHRGVSFPISESEILNSTQQQADQKTMRSLWLRHMTLKDDLRTEDDGVKVRAIPGLEGVDYLYPSFLTNMITYVFGPLIEYLVKEGGYTKNLDLQAAPWDWRLPPCELERRDGFFTKTIEQIEDMYQSCNQTPIVLLGHSLGSKIAQYLLIFALKRKGQEWIDQHIYAFMPVSGTQTGVTKSLKQTVLVDHSCLDPFLTFEELVIFSRHLGSTPWMFPTQMPAKAPHLCHIQPQGILEVRVTQPMAVSSLIQSRRIHDRPQKYQLQVALGNAKTTKAESIRLLSTAFFEKTVDGKADFSTENFYYVTPPNSLSKEDTEDLSLQMYLREPGWTKSGKDQLATNSAALTKAFSCCEWINRMVGFIFELLCCVFDITIFPLSLLNRITMDTSSILAVSEPISLQMLEANSALSQTIDFTHIHDSHKSCFHTPHEIRQAPMKVEVIWKPYDPSAPTETLAEEIAVPNDPASLNIVNEASGEAYHGMSGHDFMYKEGDETKAYLRAIHEAYDKDSHGPRSNDAPPVKRVHAIYGINIPTEIGAFYHRKDACLSSRQSYSMYELDGTGATIQATTDRYKVDGYLLKEIPTPNHPTGDGTVPYWSLSSVKTWTESLESLTVVELPQAEHRDILGDVTFQQEVLKYCRRKTEVV